MKPINGPTPGHHSRSQERHVDGRFRFAPWNQAPASSPAARPAPIVAAAVSSSIIVSPYFLPRFPDA